MLLETFINKIVKTVLVSTGERYAVSQTSLGIGQNYYTVTLALEDKETGALQEVVITSTVGDKAGE